MSRWQYCLYILRRILLAFAALGAFAASAALLQYVGIMAKCNWKPVIIPVNQTALHYLHRPVIRAPYARALEFWTWPLCIGLFGYIAFGPKQRRPIYLYYGPRFSRAYARVKQDFNAASRGDKVTGKTGSGKTQICLNPINETQTIHMRGEEKPSWAKSKARAVYEKLKAQYIAQTRAFYEQLGDAKAERDRVMEKQYTPAVESFAELLFLQLIRAYEGLDGSGSLAEAAIQEFATTPNTPIGEDFNTIAKTAARTKGDAPLSYEMLKEILDTASAAALIADRPLKLPPNCPSDLADAGTKWQQARQALEQAEAKVETIYNSINLRRQELARAADLLRPLRYKVFPWGGAIFDQKGNCYQQVQPLLERYDRPEDVIVLQVRPRGAPASWQPANRANILSFDHFPADTYAKIIVDTYNQVEECDKPDPFFVPKARNAIADGIRLLRAIRNAQLHSKLPVNEEDKVVPRLDLVHAILKDTTKTAYNHLLVAVNAMVSPAVAEKNKDAKPLLETSELTAAIASLQTSYWAQPQDQLGGVSGTLDNFLAPFSEPAIAEVFCNDNTVNFTDVEKGKVFTISIPQRFALQRVYINTIVSQIIYQVILNRGDLRKDSPEWINRNVIRQEKDEAQRLAIDADTNVDTIRELYGSTGLASQSQDALWKRFGGREKGTVPMSNLANLFICRAATYNCADESAKLITKAIFKESSTSGRAGEDKSTTTNSKEHFLVSPEELLALSDFNVIFCPAEGKWLFVQVVPCPVTPEGNVPGWWYGEANPIKILFWLLRIKQRKTKIPAKLWRIPVPDMIRKFPGFDPGKVNPFWRAKAWDANKRIMYRFLLGLDTTWYIVRRMSRSEAQRRATERSHLS